MYYCERKVTSFHFHTSLQEELVMNNRLRIVFKTAIPIWPNTPFYRFNSLILIWLWSGVHLARIINESCNSDYGMHNSRSNQSTAHRWGFPTVTSTNMSSFCSVTGPSLGSLGLSKGFFIHSCYSTLSFHHGQILWWGRVILSVKKIPLKIFSRTGSE